MGIVPRMALVVTLLSVLVLGAFTPPSAPSARAAGAAGADTLIYGDALGADWSNWSWNSAVDFGDPNPYSGKLAIRWQATAPWGGLYLHTDQPIQASAGTALQFALRANQPNQRFTAAVYGDNNRYLGGQRLAAAGGDPPTNSWKVYTIPLSSLGASGQRIVGVVLQDADGSAQAAVTVDEIALVGIAADGGAGGADCGTSLAVPEIRPGNAGYNQTPGRLTDPNKFYGNANFRPYYDKINGACTGTTEQILEWAARKWGFDQLGYADMAKAIGVVESWWRQPTVGIHGEVGILQVNPVWPDWEPAQWSTAYAADYAMAVIRSHYDGNSWLGGQTKGDLRGAVAAWECGCAYNGGGEYANRVFGYLNTKPWLRPGQPPEWF